MRLCIFFVFAFLTLHLSATVVDQVQVHLVAKIGGDSRVMGTWASHVGSGRPHIVPTSVQSETARPIQMKYKLKGNFFSLFGTILILNFCILHFKIVILHSLPFQVKKGYRKNYQVICINSSSWCSFCMLWITFHGHKIYAKTMEGQALYPRRHPL